MSCHSKFAESPEAKFLRNWAEVGSVCGMDRRLRGIKITSHLLTSSGARKRLGIGPTGNVLQALEWSEIQI